MLFKFNNGLQQNIEVTIGIIGFGKHMQDKLIPAINDCFNHKISGKIVAGCRKSKLDETKEKYNLDYITHDYKIILQDKNINTVVIAVDDISLQEQIATDAILAKKNVFVEKPVSLSPSSVAKLAKLAEKNNVVTCAGLNLTYLDSLDLLHNQITNNKERLQFDVSCKVPSTDTKNLSLIDDIKYGAYMAMIHEVSVITVLFGKPNNIKVEEIEVEDNKYYINTSFKFNDYKFPINMTFSNTSESGFDLSLNLDKGSFCKSDYYYNIKRELEIDGKKTNDKKLSYYKQFFDFFYSIQNKNQYCKNNLSNSLLCHEIIDEIIKQVSNKITFKDFKNFTVLREYEEQCKKIFGKDFTPHMESINKRSIIFPDSALQVMEVSRGDLLKRDHKIGKQSKMQRAKNTNSHFYTK